MKRIALVIVARLISVSAMAHSGGTNKNGCHRDTKNGGSHCH
ncbi:YHYH domain-containing protein [Achromobacter xylosoxidans]